MPKHHSDSPGFCAECAHGVLTTRRLGTLTPARIRETADAGQQSAGLTVSAAAGTLCVMRASLAEERLALDVFQHCQAAGRELDLGAVERRLGELRAHRAGCRCGLCDLAAKARPGGVYFVARAWVAGIAATRRRAAR